MNYKANGLNVSFFHYIWSYLLKSSYFFKRLKDKVALHDDLQALKDEMEINLVQGQDTLGLIG